MPVVFALKSVVSRIAAVGIGQGARTASGVAPETSRSWRKSAVSEPVAKQASPPSGQTTTKVLRFPRLETPTVKLGVEYYSLQHPGPC
jgi:hypothetical protein